MADLHTNGTANRAPTGAQDDIVERLRSQHSDLRQGAYYSQREDSAWDATADAADEIERLRTALEVAANHMWMTGAPQATIDAIRNAVRGG
jgi:hypothetical protein